MKRLLFLFLLIMIVFSGCEGKKVQNPQISIFDISSITIKSAPKVKTIDKKEDIEKIINHINLINIDEAEQEDIKGWEFLIQTTGKEEHSITLVGNLMKIDGIWYRVSSDEVKKFTALYNELNCEEREISETGINIIQKKDDTKEILKDNESEDNTKSDMKEINNTSANTRQNEELNGSIKNLVINSLDIQYGISNIALFEVFSNEYIKKIQVISNFYKKELKPYKIISINYDESNSISVNSPVVFVRVEDSEGQYVQIMQLITKNNKFFVNEIEYDI